MAEASNIVFLTGAARSGTTWVQNMLGCHPDIATPQESDLFSYYIAPWYEEWFKSLPESDEAWLARRHNGLPSIITEKDFDEMAVDVCQRIYGAARDLKPGTSIVLDKVPGYALYAGVIFRLLPNARILHLIRDGRDVMASLRRASKGFGRGWASETVDYGAWAWDANIRAGRELMGSDSYAEIRFEDLRGPEGATHLRRAFSFLGAETSWEECAEIVDRFSIERSGGRPPSSIVWGGEVMKRLDATPEEPSDFFGGGKVGGWKESFSWYDRWMFDRYAGDLLIELGYEKDASWTGVGTLGKAVGNVTYFCSRWKTLVKNGFGKIRRNLRPREFTLPSAAMVASKVAGESSRR